MRPRRELAAMMSGLLRWRLADVLVNLDQEQATDRAAATLHGQFNPDEDWRAAPFEMQETFRCDADVALRAALRQS